MDCFEFIVSFHNQNFNYVTIHLQLMEYTYSTRS